MVSAQNDETPEAKKCKRVLQQLSTKKVLADLFNGSEEDLSIGKRCMKLCTEYSNKKLAEFLASSVDKSNFEGTNELGIIQEVNGFIKNFCQELMIAMGKQLVIIADNENVKKTGNLNQEEQDKLKTLEKAQVQKKVLEDILYNSFITVSESFKVQMAELTKVVKETKPWLWDSDEKIKSFFAFLAGVFNDENGVPRVILMFSLMMMAHKADVTWVDEIAEALKNCG